MLTVDDIVISKKFYSEVLGLKAVNESDDCVIFSQRYLAIQSRKTGIDADRSEGHTVEICLTATDFSDLWERLQVMEAVIMVHDIRSNQWGQQFFRFYDPDHNIIRISEDMRNVCRRISCEGRVPEDIAKMTGTTVRFVQRALYSSKGIVI